MRIVFLTIVLCLICGIVAAANCPYCGRGYGAAAPGDWARVNALRRSHEANCASRPRGTGGGGGGGQYISAWQRSENLYNLAYNQHQQGKSDLALWNLGWALWFNSNNQKARNLRQKILDERIDRRVTQHRMQGNRFARKGQFDAAIAQYRAALALRPKDNLIKIKLELLQRDKRAHAAFNTGNAYYRAKRYDLAIKNYEKAIAENPEEHKFSAMLSEAKKAKVRVEIDATHRALATLTKDISRTPGGRGSLAFADPFASRGKTSIDRIHVPTPDIVEKDYVQIRTPTTWPASLKPAVKLTNQGLKVLQDSAYLAAEQAVDDMKNHALGEITKHIPGYETFSNLKGKFKRLWGSLKKAETDLMATNFDMVKRTVGDVSGMGPAYSMKQYEAQKKAAFDTTQKEIIDLVKETTEWGVKGEWKLGK